MFSTTKTSGKDITTARFIVSSTTPWFIAPSPKLVITTLPSSAFLADSAAPAAIGTPAPTIEFSPKKPFAEEEKNGDPARPPFNLDSLPIISANIASAGTPFARAHP